jgi:hypothetical protein
VVISGALPSPNCFFCLAFHETQNVTAISFWYGHVTYGNKFVWLNRYTLKPL